MTLIPNHPHGSELFRAHCSTDNNDTLEVWTGPDGPSFLMVVENIGCLTSLSPSNAKALGGLLGKHYPFPSAPVGKGLKARYLTGAGRWVDFGQCDHDGDLCIEIYDAPKDEYFCMYIPSVEAYELGLMMRRRYE